MARKEKILVLLVLFVLVVALGASLAEADGKEGGGKGNSGGKGSSGKEGSGSGNGNDKGKGDGNGKEGGGNGNGKDKGGTDGKEKGGTDEKGNWKDKGEGNGKGKDEKEDERVATHYRVLSPDAATGQERALCMGAGRCFLQTLTCPKECSERKPKKAKKKKGCFINCGSKCETTCKYRKPNCEGYGAICYDPRFVGGDGVMFYFHGSKGGNFALVSDDQLHINAHFIGSRPMGRTRDFTWVQALAVMFDTHTLVIGAQRVTKWDDDVDALSLWWDSDYIVVPTDGEAEWRSLAGERLVVVERTAATNSVRVTVHGLVEMDIKVVPIGVVENRVHNYQLPGDDAFAHLEMQFRFTNLSERVEGVLGQTYKPNYVSAAKIGVPMPMMGGEDRYRTPSFLSPTCAACIFRRQPVETEEAYGVNNYSAANAAF